MRRNYYGKTIIDFARTSLAEIMAELVKPMGEYFPRVKIKNIRKCPFYVPSLRPTDFANLTILAWNSVPHIHRTSRSFHQFFNSNMTRTNRIYLRNLHSYFDRFSTKPISHAQWLYDDTKKITKFLRLLSSTNQDQEIVSNHDARSKFLQGASSNEIR